MLYNSLHPAAGAASVYYLVYYPKSVYPVYPENPEYPENPNPDYPYPECPPFFMRR